MVIDASVVFKWLADEEGADQALALITRERLFAPTLLLSEIGNALWKKARREQIDPAVSFDADLLGLTMIISILDESACLPRALAMARALDHPIYDCVYLAIAETHCHQLVTADRRFIARTRRSEWSHLVEELA